ncbi:MAG: hypothetical protein WAW42_00780 [Candidatus Competibacteraceae bacterium]
MNANSADAKTLLKVAERCREILREVAEASWAVQGSGGAAGRSSRQSLRRSVWGVPRIGGTSALTDAPGAVTSGYLPKRRPGYP